MAHGTSTSTPSPCPPLDKVEHLSGDMILALALLLSSASEALGRTVTSLEAITADERDLVRSYAYGQLSLTTGSVAA